MAKKKAPKKAPKRRGKSGPDVPPGLPDRRALEAMMRDLFAGAIGPADDTALGRAQDIIYEALDSPDPKKRARLAKKALEISPDCADAYVLLAEGAEGRKDALALYEQAVAAGERALGPEVFRDHVGHFWGLLETRPYMRAREGLAHVLWTMGRRDEAIGHLQEMLRLNPGDNQGQRYILASWLLAEERDDELARLLVAYDEDSAEWSYAKALATFRREGDTPHARKLLQEAKKANKHVPDYVLGRKPLPPERPGSYSLGSESEAILYAGAALPGWKATPGAIEWLKGTAASRKRKAPKEKAQGPLPLVKKRLEKLPKEFDVWQADAREFGRRVEEAGELVRPWMMIVGSLTSGAVLGQELAIEPPPPALLWDTIARTIQGPMMGSPHRPIELQVPPDPRWEELTPHFEEIGVKVVPTERLEQIDLLFEDLTQFLGRDDPPSLMEATGLEPDRMADFYRAAAEFYREAPWRKLGYESAIRINCPSIKGGPWYAVVMGQSGMTFGVALYDDLKLLRRLWSNDASEEENAMQTVALSLTFDDESEVSEADLGDVKVHGFEVAGRRAYPTIFRKEKGMSIRPPLPWEVDLMEACLRSIPQFVAARRPDDPSKFEVAVPAGEGTREVTLAWVED